MQIFKDEQGNFQLKDQCTLEEEAQGELKEVFRDGKLVVDQSLLEIRTRLFNNDDEAIGH